MRLTILLTFAACAACGGEPFTAAVDLTPPPHDDAGNSEAGDDAAPGDDAGKPDAVDAAGNADAGATDAAPADDANVGDAGCFTPTPGLNPYSCGGVIPPPGTMGQVFELTTSSTCGDVPTPAVCSCRETYTCACILAFDPCGDAGAPHCYGDNGAGYLLAVTCQ